MKAPLATLALAALAAACTPAPPPAGAAAAQAGDTTLVGQVAVVGSMPVNARVVVQPDGRPALRVAGPLARELGSLSGARVRVRGRAAGDSVAVSAYEIVSVNGEPVHFGVVERAPGGALRLRRADGTTVDLLGPAAAQFRPGQKIWVQGPGSVQVQVFGVVTP